MAAHITRFSQFLVAILVTIGIIFIEFVGYGPDINGQEPPLLETIQMVGIEAVIIGIFTVAAFAVLRRLKFGWWLSIVLDGLLGVGAVLVILNDFRSRFTATQEGQRAFRGDLIIHSTILLVCTIVVSALLLGRQQFLMKKPNLFSERLHSS